MFKIYCKKNAPKLKKKIMEQPRKKLDYIKYMAAKPFKWMVLFFSIYLIVIGSMLVYESSRDAQFDTTTNIPLIAIGGVAIGLSIIVLIAMVYAQHKYPSIGLTFLYVVVTMIIFGTTVGTISIINGVDVPNSGSRGTLGWVFGGITAGVGVIAVLWAIFALIVTYQPKGAIARSKPAKYFLIDPNRSLTKDQVEDEQARIDDNQMPTVKEFAASKQDEEFSANQAI